MKPLRNILLCGIILIISSLHFEVRAQSIAECSNERISIMVLGTYHMASPGQDVVNMKVDDVLAEKRQRELAVRAEQLAKFKPTKVAVEAPRTGTVFTSRYTNWLQGTHTLGTNEIAQVGFRVARAMTLENVTPVDYPMWMNGTIAADRHTPKPRPTGGAAPADSSDARQSNPVMREVHAAVAAAEKKLASSTISEFLAYINSPDEASRHHRWDVLSNLEPGNGVSLYENTDLAVNWYKRNLRIFTNILEAAGHGDRVLLLIGAGHSRILSDLAREHPRTCLVDPRQYLR